ncbi:MAG: T9SS type A sorting domain-containing protein [candidate division WOR-3 bacterium]|nr:T9SS type A sorting domain-containing protein [candidate division WOR-3 bacterium]
MQNTDRRGCSGLDSGRTIFLAMALVLVYCTVLAGSVTDGNEWFEVAPLPGPRAFHMTAFASTDSGPRLYAIGGQRSPSDTMERLCIEYSPQPNSWRQRAAMSQRRGLGQACTVKGQVYVLGGCRTFGTGLADVEVYDPAADTWTVGPNMPEGLYDFGTVVWRDSLIFTLGGGSWHPSMPPTDTVKFFDAATSTWYPATPLPEPLGAMACGIVGDTILVATGWTDSGPTNKAWMGLIDPVSPTVIYWSELDTLPGPRRCRAACGVVNNELYVIGGLTLDGTAAESIRHTAYGIQHPALGLPSSSFILQPSSFSALSDVWSVGAATGLWHERAAKPHPVSSVFGTGTDPAGRIYVPGGYPGAAPYSQTTEYLDMTSFAHDVGVAGVVSPSGRLVPDDPCPVLVLIRNFGAAGETPTARITILDSATQAPVFDRDTVLQLAPDSSQQVDFGVFLPSERTVFHATAFVSLTGDENPGNDTSRQRSRTTTGSDPDGFGYVYESSQEPDSVAFSWFDTAGGTVIDDWNPNPDEGTSRRHLPFKFRFYGDSTDRVHVCTNGYIQTSNSIAGLNFPLPFEDITDIIAPFWDDISLRDTGQVYENLTSEQAVYTWVGAARAQPDTGLLTFQVILEHSGNIRFNYLDVTADATSSTVGIQGDDGSWNWYQQYVYDANPLKHVPADSTSILFRAPGVGLAEPHSSLLPPPASLFVSPNPCHGRATVRISGSSFIAHRSSLSLYDASGRFVRSFTVSTSPFPLSTSDLPPGAYFLRSATPQGSLTSKLVLLH